MTGSKLLLSEKWTVGNRIGDPSGMATVYQAENESGTRAAIKFIPKKPGAARELLFESLSGSPNILPIIDTGETADFHVLVMPLADKSLRQHLQDCSGKVAAEEAVAIISQIASGLDSLEGEVVHRDLKPENILFFDGVWCIADFGIARYAEAATDAETHKFAMTPPYASPEQWNLERSTARTDIYALGVIAFEVISGSRPFPGPEQYDYRKQHLHDPAPQLKSGLPTLDSIVSDCLRKSPAARPTAGRLIERLSAALRVATPAMEKLRQIDRSLSVKEAQEEAISSSAHALAQTRQVLFRDACDAYNDIVNRLADAATASSDRVTVRKESVSLALSLGQGTLVMTRPQSSPGGALGSRSGPYANVNPFDVVAYSSIGVSQTSSPRHSGNGRFHSLWFCDAHTPGDYRWFELSFMANPMTVRGLSSMDPVAMDPQVAQIAFQRIMGGIQLAWKPMPIDHEREAEFSERWLEWFAQVATGSYQSPSSAPDEPSSRRGYFRNE